MTIDTLGSSIAPDVGTPPVDAPPDPVDWAGIARVHGTPAYVYDLAAVRAAYAALTADLPQPSGLVYSVKANPHPAVVGTLVAAGAGAEVSSAGELAVALSTGCPPERVLYTGPGKTFSELCTALAAGVRLFSIESPGDRRRLEEACELLDTEADALVRLNHPPASRGGSLRMTGRPSAFGTDVANTAELAALLRPGGRVRPVGTHTFFATNVQDPGALLDEFRNALDAVRAVCGEDFPPAVLALGGGFSAPNARPGTPPRHRELGPDLAEHLDAAFPGWRAGRPRLLFESGRHLVAAAGTLLSTLLDVKRSGGRTFAVLDAGVNTLGGMSGLGRLRAPNAQPRVIGARAGSGSGPAGLPEDGAGGPVALVGPLCTPLDVLNNAAELAAPEPGQILAFPNVGAYGPTASLLAFLSRPAPVEVVVDDGTVRGARRLVLRAEEVCPGV